MNKKIYAIFLAAITSGLTVNAQAQQFCLAPITATTECVEDALACYGVKSWNHQKYASGLAKLCDQVADKEKERMFLAEKVDFLEQHSATLATNISAGNAKYLALEKRYRRLAKRLNKFLK